MKVALIFVLILMSFVTNKNAGLEELKQLEGIWRMQTKKGYLYESWRKVSEGELSGNSYKVTDADSVLLESIRLVYKGGEVFYIPTVSDQNNGQPVSFKMVSSENQKFIFENPEHDFPQRIVYHFINSDSLVANIEGSYNDKEASSYFYFSRMK